MMLIKGTIRIISPRCIEDVLSMNYKAIVTFLVYELQSEATTRVPLQNVASMKIKYHPYSCLICYAQTGTTN